MKISYRSKDYVLPAETGSIRNWPKGALMILHFTSPSEGAVLPKELTETVHKEVGKFLDASGRLNEKGLRVFERDKEVLAAAERLQSPPSKNTGINPKAQEAARKDNPKESASESSINPAEVSKAQTSARPELAGNTDILAATGAATAMTASCGNPVTPKTTGELIEKTTPENAPKGALEANPLYCDDDFGRLGPRKIKISDIVISEYFSATHDDILDPALVESIKENGLLNPIAVTAGPPHNLIAGRTRLHGCEHLGYSTIDAILYEVPDDKLSEFILEHDIHREIGNIEKTRRFAGYLTVEQIRAKMRQRAGKKVKGNSPEGSARDLAAGRVRMDGKTLEVALRLLLEIDRRLADTALAANAKAVKAVFDKSIHGALKKAHKEGWDIQGWQPPKRTKQKVAVKSSDSARDGTAASSGGAVQHDDPELKDTGGDPEFLIPKVIVATAQTLWPDSSDRTQVGNFTCAIAATLERVSRLYPDIKWSELLRKAVRLVEAIEAQNPVEVIHLKDGTTPKGIPDSAAPASSVTLDPIVKTPSA